MHVMTSSFHQPERKESAPVTPALSGLYCVSAEGPIESTWVELDGVRLPCIVRLGRQYVPVRVAEQQLLQPVMSRLSSSSLYNFSRPLIASFYLTPAEADVLTAACIGQADQGPFSDTDLVVPLDEFGNFYNDMKNRTSGTVAVNGQRPQLTSGGWIQVNNSVIPCVNKNGSRLLPLSVIQNAANLLTDVDVSAQYVHRLTSNECRFLNELCTTAGLVFTFDATTPMVDLSLLFALQSSRPIFIKDLPQTDPFGSARYIDETAIAMCLPQPSSSNATGATCTSLPTTAKQVVAVKNTTSATTATSREFAMVPIVFENKTISSLQKKNGTFVLLEAICRVFFRSQNVNDFVHCVENVLKCPVVSMTPDEEKYFIEFYRLPTNCLRCKKLISIDHFKEHFTRLTNMFGSSDISDGDATAAKSSPPASVNNNSINVKDRTKNLTPKPKRARQADDPTNVIVID